MQKAYNINIIVSISENLAIGKDNKLLWKLSSDLQNFKKITTGHSVIMGQKTFESLPNGPLPNRINIILSDDPNFVLDYENTYIVSSIEKAIETAEYYSKDGEIFIIGGGSIYKQFLPYANKLYLTVVHTIIDGDTFFPEIGDEWKLESEEFKSKDEKNEFKHTYKIFTRCQ